MRFVIQVVDNAKVDVDGKTVPEKDASGKENYTVLFLLKTQCLTA